MSKRSAKILVLLFVLSACQPVRLTPAAKRPLSALEYLDKTYGAWQAIMVANHTGLQYEGLFLKEPSADESIHLALLNEWSTDDDTAVEWVDLHILETYGINPTYKQIRDEWVAHLNNDIWNATRRARDLMDQGLLPPDTGSAHLNPDGAWSISAQLQTELFGLIAPGMPKQAAQRARYFARVTNSGPAVEASALYAAMYALAYFENDVQTVITEAQKALPGDSQIGEIVRQVRIWHSQDPEYWRGTREMIRQAYDTDPEWWGSRVNLASTIMALLYGEGDMMKTLTIACLAGWDADNNATTSAGLIGIMHGFEALPEAFRSATDVYFNQDVTGGLPQYDSVRTIAARTQTIAEVIITATGGSVEAGEYWIGSGN